MRSFCALVLTATVTGLPIGGRSEVVNGIAAIVHDTIITYEDVGKEIQAFIGSLQARYGDKPEVFSDKLRELQGERIEMLVEKQLILHEFQTAGYVLPEGYVEDRWREHIDRRFGDRPTMIKTLQDEGTTYESYKQKFRENIILTMMRSHNVPEDIVISPFKIESYYQEHQEKYQLEDQVKLRMINFDKANHDATVVELVRDVYAKLKEGVPFAEMAAVYSEGRQGKEGGDWGWIERKVLREDLAEVAFSLKPGQWSEILDRPEAYYIMLVEDMRPAHVRPLAEVRDEIEADLKRLERARLEAKWIERLKRKSFIRYFPEAM